jgi:UDP-N-acetylmuramate-alanine ligase
MLAELMRMQKTIAVAGTHGKTTTTSMIACLLDAGGIDPTVINGGIINRYGSNARLGKSDWMVVEADESDGSFLRLDGTIAVVTNIDPEHLEHYGSFENAKDAFVEFVENVPFYGLAVMCIDHPEVQSLIGRIRDRRIVTYGFSALADLRADNVEVVGGGSRFDAIAHQRDGSRRTIAGITLPMPGRHNVLNALAAVAVGIELGMDDGAIITNIDPEHLDHYGDFDAVKKAFCDFIEDIPFYGFGVVCLDHPEVQKLAAQIDNRRLVTYGLNPQAMVRAESVQMSPDGARFDVVVQGQGLAALDEPIRIEGLYLPMAGWHNVSNSLAAIAVARELGVDDDALRAGLAGFGGVKRRFTTTGVVGGVRVIDDYGHHPVEISAVLKAARQVVQSADNPGRVIAVVQPHRYTRLRDLMEEFSTCFSDADAVLVADVYPAGEQPIQGVDKHALADGIRRYGHRNVAALENAAVLPRVIKDEARPGDLVVLLGAGDITSWAYALPAQLEALG